MGENNNFKILVADNDQDFLAIAEHKLSMRGFQVIVATLNESVKTLKKESIDFIFMDIHKISDEGAPILKYVESLKTKPLIQYFGLQSSHEKFANLEL